MHSGKNLFSCTQRNCSATTASCLKRHMLIHSEEKSFRCELCDHSCTQAENLINHKLKKSVFFHIRSLTILPVHPPEVSHAFTHCTGEKPLACKQLMQTVQSSPPVFILYPKRIKKILLPVAGFFLATNDHCQNG